VNEAKLFFFLNLVSYNHEQGLPETCERPFIPIFFKLFQPIIVLTALFLVCMPKFPIISEEMFRVWKPAFTGVIFLIIPLTFWRSGRLPCWSASWSGPDHVDKRCDYHIIFFGKHIRESLFHLENYW